MKETLAILISTSVGFVAGVLFILWLPYSADCKKANNNVRGSIEYRCGCPR